MNISIFGMGYVGCVLASGHAKEGHKIIGVDINKNKLDLLKKGKSPIVEKDIDRYIKEAVDNDVLITTDDAKFAVMQTDISIICVGTPSNDDGSINLDFTERVCRDIAIALKDKENYHLIVFKSTLFPGVIEEKMIPLIAEISGKRPGIEFGIVHNPEFLREGCAMEDFFDPNLIIFGELDKKSGDTLDKIYDGIRGKKVRTSIRIGEMIKYVNNTFHGLKVSFANEIGKISSKFGINSQDLMNVFCMDDKLNISKAYLKPGAPYGGSCLTKDLEALKFEAGKQCIKIPVLDSIKLSNDSHIEYCVNAIKNFEKRKIGILGLSFKEDTDDLRESPMLFIINSLHKEGYEIKIYDQNLNQGKIKSDKILLKKYPYIDQMMSESMESVIKDSETIIIKNKCDEFKNLPRLIKPEQIIIDFCNIFSSRDFKSNYHRIV